MSFLRLERSFCSSLATSADLVIDKQFTFVEQMNGTFKLS